MQRIVRFSDRHPWFTNPFVWTLVSTAFTIIPTIILARVATAGGGHVEVLQNYLVWAALLAGPATALAATVVFYPSNEKILRRVVFSFLAVMLTYANVYFAISFIRAYDDPPPIYGMHSVLSPQEDGTWTMLEKNVLHAYADALDYSVQTITTAGMSDMHGTKWWSKLLTDSEVLIGLGITVVGFGRYFSARRQ